MRGQGRKVRLWVPVLMGLAYWEPEGRRDASEDDQETRDDAYLTPYKQFLLFNLEFMLRGESQWRNRWQDLALRSPLLDTLSSPTSH